MSIKFKPDGAIYPTMIRDDVLTVDMGDGSFDVKLPFHVPSYDYDSTVFPMSDIMGYFDNGQEILVIRFSGTATRFSKDLEVLGFVKFDTQSILSNIVTLNVGAVFDGQANTSNCQSYPCSIRIPKSHNFFTFECSNDPEPLVIKPENNEKFMEEIMKGNRISPALVKTGANQYEESRGAYQVIGRPLRSSGFADI